MEYLDNVLGIHTVYKDDPPKSMPNYIYERYRVQKVVLDGTPAVFLYPKEELEAIGTVKKHISRVQKSEGVPVVLVPEKLTYRQKEYLLRDHIPFIVEGKQIYLPFMAVYLQERGDAEKHESKKILPSAQVLLLYYIYHGCGELLTSEASRELSFTPTSIYRATGQLEETGLVHTEKRGVQKVIYSDKSPEELFSASKDYLLSPVKRTIYVPKSMIRNNLLMSGYSALSEYTMLNPSAVVTVAADSVAAWEKAASNRLQNADEEYEVELWRYDPKRLADGECVDRLSLALSFPDDNDERTEEAVDEMLDEVWREIDGKRN